MKKALHLIGLPIFALLLVLSLNPNQVHAEVSSQIEARNVCLNHMNYILSQKGTWAGSTSPTLADYEGIYENNRLVGHYYEIEPNGWVVVPLLKELPPLKAGSQSGRLDFSDPEGMAALLREVLYDAVITYEDIYGSLDASQPTSGDVPFPREASAHWDRYVVSPKEFQADLALGSRDTIDEIGPLVTAHHDQGDPYNLFCPMGDGGRVVVGCVATAAVMIMDYHEWPPFGIDSAYYLWSGDESCGDDTPDELLKVYLDDPYDWDNILDYCGGNYPAEQQEAVAELCYEVAVAYRMQFGRCGSGAYVTDGAWVFPEKFRYIDTIQTIHRPGLTLEQWYNYAREDIELLRPISYRITRHAIVLDGCRVADGLKQFHFNYGWNTGHNAWYTVDHIYCPWEGCTTADQMMLRRIIPDREVMYEVDTVVGMAPLTVNFEGSSNLAVDTWTYDFGDGFTSNEQSPTHVFESGGNFDVSLEVNAGGYVRSLTRPKLIIAVADTLSAMDYEVDRDSSGIVVEIHARNAAPLTKMKIPVNYGGDLPLTLDSFGTQGCRTEWFEICQQSQWSPGLTTVLLQNTATGEGLELDAGNGPVLCLYFSIPQGSQPGQSATLDLSGYGNYQPMFYGSKMDYEPDFNSGSITVVSCCTGGRGNVDGDPADEISIADLLYLVDWMFNGGPDFPCIKEADVNATGDIDITDVIYLVAYMFQGGFPPPSCLQ